MWFNARLTAHWQSETVGAVGWAQSESPNFFDGTETLTALTLTPPLTNFIASTNLDMNA